MNRIVYLICAAFACIACTEPNPNYIGNVMNEADMMIIADGTSVVIIDGDKPDLSSSNDISQGNSLNDLDNRQDLMQPPPDMTGYNAQVLTKFMPFSMRQYARSIVTVKVINNGSIDWDSNIKLQTWPIGRSSTFYVSQSEYQAHWINDSTVLSIDNSMIMNPPPYYPNDTYKLLFVIIAHQYGSFNEEFMLVDTITNLPIPNSDITLQITVLQ